MDEQFQTWGSNDESVVVNDWITRSLNVIWTLTVSSQKQTRHRHHHLSLSAEDN